MVLVLEQDITVNMHEWHESNGTGERQLSLAIF